MQPTVLTRPVKLPELPLNADGTPFDTDKALKDIADAGTQWRQEHLRKEDMEVRSLLPFLVGLFPRRSLLLTPSSR